MSSPSLWKRYTFHEIYFQLYEFRFFVKNKVNAMHCFSQNVGAAVFFIRSVLMKHSHPEFTYSKLTLETLGVFFIYF